MIPEPENTTIDTLVRILLKSRSLLFITGAGVSAESGIPTYRGIGGLYNVDTTEDGVPIEEALSASMLAENPALTWKYLAQIGRAVQGAGHNRAHEVIAEMESHFHRVWTLTQNVDGFHRAAGSKNLIEAHGNMHSLSCTKCKYTESLETFDAIEIPPKCPRCGALVRPDVVLFGELIDGPGVEHIQTELLKRCLKDYLIGGLGQFLPVYFSLQGFQGLNDLIKRRWFFEYHFLHRFVVTLQLGLDFPVRKQFKRLRVASQIVSSPTLAIEYSFVIGYFRK